MSCVCGEYSLEPGAEFELAPAPAARAKCRLNTVGLVNEVLQIRFTALRAAVMCMKQ
jgi:hypothetical protein